MAQKLSLYLLVFTLAGSGFWIYRLHQESDELRVKIKSQEQSTQDLKKQLEELNRAVSKEQAFINNEKDQANAELQNLSGQLQNELSRLESQTQKINDLKNQINPLSQDLQARFIQQNSLVADLEARLKLATNAEKELAQAGDSALKNTKAQTQVETQSLSAQIQSQQALVKSTQDQLNFWRGRKGDINQGAKLEEYQHNLAQQTATLQQLQTQKLNVNQVDQSKIVNIKQEISSEKMTIKSSELQLQEQLQRAQGELKTIKDQQQGEQKSVSEIKNRIHAIEQDYAIDYAKYQSLRESFKKKQAELQKIQSSNH